jgi:uncharacterized membrane protein
MGKLENAAIVRQFQGAVKDMVKPGTSTLFLIIDKVTPDKAVAALSRYGCTLLNSLSKKSETELQKVWRRLDRHRFPRSPSSGAGRCVATAGGCAGWSASTVAPGRL